MWLWHAGPGPLSPDELWRAYLARFDIEHYAVVPVMRDGRASALAAAVTGPRLSALSPPPG
jgi:hypothetical protein